MHSLPTRVNTVASMGFTALAVCAAVMASITFVNETWLAPSMPTARITVRPTQLVRTEHPHPLKPSSVRSLDRCIVFLDVVADFTPSFNWNTKQVYVYAVAHYTTKQMKRNEVTLWDTILTSSDQAKLNLPRVADYFFDDYGTNLRGANVTVRLWYHIMSHSGFTFTREVEAAATSFIAN
jgi:signal peptidase complex subunit 3